MSERSAECAYGIELNEFGDVLSREEYPVRAERLAAEYGDHELRVVGGRVSVDEVLATHAACNAAYDSPAEVRDAIHTLVGDAAVGRSGYSDRGAPTLNRRHDSV